MPTLTDAEIQEAIFSLCEHYQQNTGSNSYLELAHKLAYTALLQSYFAGVTQALGIVYPIPV